MTLYAGLPDTGIANGNCGLFAVRLYVRQCLEGGTSGERHLGWSVTALAILCSVVPTGEIHNVWLFEFKLAGYVCGDRVGLVDLPKECALLIQFFWLQFDIRFARGLLFPVLSSATLPSSCQPRYLAR